MENIKSLLPKFNDDGLLPIGDHELTIQQLKESYLVTENKFYMEIDSKWRLILVNNLEILVNQLWIAGIDNIFIDGSFVENKSKPCDIDGYFEIDIKYFALGEFQTEINKIDRYKVWNWSHNKIDPVTKKPKIDMWHIYKVELYPHFNQLCGIVDEFGNELTFPSAFRQSRKFKPKGIIKIIKA